MERPAGEGRTDDSTSDTLTQEVRSHAARVCHTHAVGSGFGPESDATRFVPRTLCDTDVAELAMQATGRSGIAGDQDPLDVCVLAERPLNQAVFWSRRARSAASG